MTTSHPHPLSDIRVLDLSRVLSGPLVGRIMADLGAEVLKVEPPEGDVSRFWGRVQDGVSGFFLQQNVGKKCVTVDLKAAGATELVLGLAREADIVIENFRPGVMDRLGLGYQQLADVNPGVILLSITGFGQVGPQAGRAAYAPVVHAESGLMARQAQFDEAPVTDLMLALADTLAGLHGVIAVLAALQLRAKTGTGQHVDVAMLDSMLASDDYAHHALDGFPIRRLRSDVWDTVAGPILLAGEFRWLWRQLSTVHGLTDGVGEDADVDTKVRSRRAAVADWLRSFDDRDEMLAALAKASIATGTIQDFMSVFETEHARFRECFATIPVAAGRARRGVD
jgi:CoA:oxalate CoA-transferase